MEARNLSDREFKVLVIRMLKELRENNNSMKKNLETMKNNQAEMKNAISEIQNSLEGVVNRLNEAEDRICKLGAKIEKNHSIRTEKRRNN